MQTYIVQPGDTLYGISKQYGISVEEIRLANNLISNNIVPQQVLKIPTSTTVARYIVRPGDTLFKIASLYDTTVSELIEINNLKTNVLSIGQQLLVPINEEDSSTGTIIYTVKSGDNLYSIAKNYNTSVDDIKTLNNLTSNLLSIGQKLRIPVNSTSISPENVETYVVQSGDTLYKIANYYNMSVKELMDLNNLTSNVLSIGQVLKVKTRNEDQIPSGVACYGEGYVTPRYETYTVKRGDSLYTIARRFKTTVDDLIKLNVLNNTNLSIGQILKIREV